MKKILLLVFCLLFAGCSNNDVNASPESVIKGYMEAIVSKDETLLKQCLDTQDKVTSLLENNYNDFKMIKIQSLSDNESLYAYTGLLNYGEDLSIPYINVVEVLEKDQLYYIVSSSIKNYSDKAVGTIQSLQESEVYKEYMSQMQSFLSQENLEKLYKSVEDFKNSEQYEQYMTQLNEYINSEQFKSAIEDIKNFTSSDAYNQLTSDLNNFIQSDQFKNMYDDLMNFINGQDLQDIYDKLGQLFK